MSDAELRELDARFAREVLGRVVEGIDNPPPFEMTMEPTEEQRKASPAMTLYPWLPTYTRSLDAAWGGAVVMRRRLNEIGMYCYLELLYHYEGECTATFNFADSKKITVNSGHPAEAIVRLCLLAHEVAEK